MKSKELLNLFLDEAERDNVINPIMLQRLKYRVQFYGNLHDIKTGKVFKQNIQTCGCGASFNGVECSKCDFDASEIDIY